MSYLKFYTDKVQRSMEKWDKTNDKLMPLHPKFKVFCPFCFMSKLYEFLEELEDNASVKDVKKAIIRALEYASDVAFKHRNVFSPSKDQYRIDMLFKCMRCDFVFTFGVHIDEDYYNKIGQGTMHVPYEVI